MFDFKLKWIDKYTAPQKTVYTTPELQILFCVQGLVSYHQPGLDLESPGAYLHVLPRGTVVDFEFGPDRENWVIQLETEAIRPAAEADEIEVLTDRVWIPMTALVPVTREHIAGWQGEFIRMRDAFRDPHPKSQLRIQVGVANVFRYLLDRQPDSLGETPPQQLKRLIAEDEQCRKSLDDLSRACGYSSDHLRKLFVEEYGLTPQAYRNQHRMATAVHLLGNSQLTVKEIARNVGFRHVSHFSTMFRKTYDITPREAIGRYRAGKAGWGG